MEEETPQVEFEVEDVLRYRRDSSTGDEYFLVKWQGFPPEEGTWEPLAHLNDNCKELIMKARALFAWRKTNANAQLPECSEIADPYLPLPEDERVVENFVVDELPEDPSDVVLQMLSPIEGQPPSKDPSPTTTDAMKRAAEAPANMPAKRPKLHAPSIGPPNNAPSRDVATVDGPPSKTDLDSLAKWQDGPMVACSICKAEDKRQSVEKVLGGRVPYNYHCPPCRIERVDEFHPAVGAGVLRYSYASAPSTISLSFQAQAAQWRKQQWAVHLRSTSLNSAELAGPTWAHRVTGKLNGKQCVAIDPPKHLHVRREQCYNLTPLLRAGLNTLELKLLPRPDKPRNEPDEAFCIGVVLTRPRSVASIIARIRSKSQETVSSGRERVERIIRRADKLTNADDCKVTGNFGRLLKPMCPISYCPIEEAAIGRPCNHVQVFDLQSYVAVNQRMRSLDKRWTCPVCAIPLRPDDVILDPFSQGILDTLRGDEDLVEAVVFNENCTWSTISATKADDEKGNGEDGGDGTEAVAPIVDLSDSDA